MAGFAARRARLRSTRTVATLVGTLLGVLTLLKVLDLGAFAVLDRPFNVVTDRSLLGSGVGFVRDSLGPWAATGGCRRRGRPRVRGRRLPPLGRSPPHDRGRAGTGRAARAVTALAVVWVVCAVAGLQVAPGEPVAAADMGPFVADKVRADDGRPAGPGTVRRERSRRTPSRIRRRATCLG